MRYVFKPACAQRGAGLRAGLPVECDHDSDRVHRLEDRRDCSERPTVGTGSFRIKLHATHDRLRRSKVYSTKCAPKRSIPIAAGGSALATDCDAGSDPNGSRAVRDGRCADFLGPNRIQDVHRFSQPRSLHLARSRTGRQHPSSGASARSLAGLAWASDLLDEPGNRGVRWLFRTRSGADNCSLAATKMVSVRCFDPTESANPGNSHNRGNWYPQYRLLSDDLYRHAAPILGMDTSSA